MFRLTVSILFASLVTGAQADAQAVSYPDDGESGTAVQVTPYPPQMSARTDTGWGGSALLTVGESIRGYTPPGILDGMYAFRRDDHHVRLLVNHELSANVGYAYSLSNGTALTGARISYFDIDSQQRAIRDAGLAYSQIFARNGESVTQAADLEFGGLNRLCSANGVEAKTFGFEDRVYLAGEEAGGGTLFALDERSGALWAVPAAGRAAFESVTPIEPPSDDTVALLIGDDRGGAPLLLYIGEKRSGGFLERNGLANGLLYVWVAKDPAVVNPNNFNGTGAAQNGRFVEIDVFRPDLAGTAGYDQLGYANQSTQDVLAFDVAGAFAFSRPEDLHTNPDNPLQAVLASTGLSSLFPSDRWGTTYRVEIAYDHRSKNELFIRSELIVLYDGDDAGFGQFFGPDYGLRSPDNLTWAGDGNIYIQEDRSFGGFGQTSGEEASIWKLDPQTGLLSRIAQMDRNVVAPVGVTDSDPTDIGDWESSGIIDVTDLFDTAPGEVLLMGNSQAHSVRDGVIGGAAGLVQGGQLFFLNYWAEIGQ